LRYFQGCKAVPFAARASHFEKTTKSNARCFSVSSAVQERAAKPIFIFDVLYVLVENLVYLNACGGSVIVRAVGEYAINDLRG
jgi:hypothetical protein